MNPRAAAEAIFRAAVRAAEPAPAVAGAVHLENGTLRVGNAFEMPLPDEAGIWLIGAGKASAGMAEGALRVLGERVRGGSITVPHGLGRTLPGVDVWEARHPTPDASGLAGAADALALARRARESDLVLCLLSGGASSLWPAPPPGVTLGDLQRLTAALLRAGAPIEEINTVRRHLSMIAGGGLARAASPAATLTLAISDVVSGSPESIGSGPGVADPTTFRQALEVLSGFEVAVPAATLRHLQLGAAGEVPETLKAGELEFEPALHVIASVRDALAAAAEEAARLGYDPTVVTDRLEGEASTVGREIAGAAVDLVASRGARRALLWGGETTVAVRGDGRGGRNQELALSAAVALNGREGITIGALATDGVDGPTPAAGAIVDAGTTSRGAARGLDAAAALRRNDSHTFLQAAGDLVTTGPTGTNVNDIVVALVG